MLLTPDEETGSHGTRALFEQAGRHHHFGLEFEPGRTNGDIIHSRKGTGNFVVTCTGRAAQTTLWDNLDISARRYPDKSAFVFFARHFSFVQIRALAQRLAGWLH